MWILAAAPVRGTRDTCGVHQDRDVHVDVHRGRLSAQHGRRVSILGRTKLYPLLHHRMG